MMNLYKAGEVDAVVQPHRAGRVGRSHPRLQGLHGRARRTRTSTTSSTRTRPPMNDVRVRQGVQHGDRQGGAGRVSADGQAADGVRPEGIFPGYPEPTGDPFDPAARARAARRGRLPRCAAATTTRRRFPVSDVDISYNTPRATGRSPSSSRRNGSRTSALTVPLKNMEFRTFLSRARRLEYRGVARAGWVGDYMDPFTFLNLFSTTAATTAPAGATRATSQMLQRRQPRARPAASAIELLAQRRSDAARGAADHSALHAGDQLAEEAVREGHVRRTRSRMHPWKYVYIEHDPAKWD